MRHRYVLLCAYVILAVTCLGREYFVSPQGSDLAAGSQAAPWQSIAKANESLQPGDTVIFLDGSYLGTISPGRSGTMESPIVYRTANHLGAVLLGGLSAESLCLSLTKREYIVVEGFSMRPDRGDLMRLEAARHCIIRKCRLEGGASWSPILCVDSHYNRYEDLVCGNITVTGPSGHVRGDCWTNQASSHNVFLRIYFSRVGHCPLNFWNDSPYNIVRQCTFDAQWGRNFEFFGTPHVLVEQCVITNGFDGSGSADGRAKLFTSESIFRRNLIYRNHYVPLVVNAYRIPNTPVFRMEHARVYHNTWFHNYGPGFEMLVEESGTVDGALPVLADNVFKNNIFARNDVGGDGISLLLDPAVSGQTKFVANNLHGSEVGGPAVRLDTAHPDWAKRGVDTWHGELLSTAEADQSRPGQFQDNLDVAPQFASEEQDDFRLKPESGCRDAGLPLATVTTAGAGQVMRVDDARWFFDGFGIPGEEGDLIMVGNERKIARVQRVDVASQTITLDRNLAWKEGDAVSLPYVGSAPDLGAYEYNADAELWYRAPKKNAGFETRAAVLPAATLLMTDFEPENQTDWFYYWNFSRQRNTSVQLDGSTAAQGRHSLRVFATQEGSVLACDIKPREWDVDKSPFITFSYRIPRGVPVGIWLWAFKSSQVGRGMVCVGGTCSRDAAPYRDLARYELVDDGQWHQITLDARTIRQAYPGVKLLQAFRFYTSNNGKAGDQFWFDRFQIHVEEAKAPDGRTAQTR